MSRVSGEKLWARLAQVLAQIGPGPGPFWAGGPKSLILNHYSTFRSKSSKIADKSNGYRCLGWYCSLLRQVCVFSGWNRRPTPSRGSKILGDGAARPAASGPRHGSVGVVLGFALGGLLLHPGFALAENGWHRGSSFDANRAEAAWKRNGFEEKKASLQPKDPSEGRETIRFMLDPDATPLANLRNLISTAEAGAGDYNSVQFGAVIKPTGIPTIMTLDDIRAWVAATPGQAHAIGRYQFIPATFERLAAATGTDGSAIFDAKLQDRWANVLLGEAGYAAFVAGRIAPETFMDNLASVWAGLPLASGLSAYEGIAGNHATVTRAAYVRAITAIFPAQSALASASR